jgi:hypothetical protein
VRLPARGISNFSDPVDYSIFEHPVYDVRFHLHPSNCMLTIPSLNSRTELRAMDSSEMVLTNFPVSSIIVYDSYNYLALNLAVNRRITHEKVRRINLRNWLSLPILPTLRIAPLCH